MLEMLKSRNMSIRRNSPRTLVNELLSGYHLSSSRCDHLYVFPSFLFFICFIAVGVLFEISIFENTKPHNKFIFQFRMSKILVSVCEKIHHLFDDREREKAAEIETETVLVFCTEESEIG